jgi:hypothetical protein
LSLRRSTKNEYKIGKANAIAITIDSATGPLSSSIILISPQYMLIADRKSILESAHLMINDVLAASLTEEAF